MKRFFFQVMPLALFSILLQTPASGQGFLKTDGKTIVNGNGEKVLLRGMGLGGWMLQEGYMLKVENIGSQQHVVRAKIEELIGPEKTQKFYDAWLANHTRKIDVDSMAAWGFNSLRLPMHFNLFTLPAEAEPVKGENTWLEKGFTLTDNLLKWCAANHLYLILDLHAAPGGQGNDLAISDRDETKPSLWQSEANQQKMIALWKKLAERYAKEPWVGAYDIINEPNWGFESKEDGNGCGEKKNEPLKKLMTDITQAIREVDKNHIIIIEGNCWGNNYSGVLPLWDNNTVMSFHKYWNNNDEASIKKYLDLREENNAPVWLGESGENSNAWFSDNIRLMETNGIGWCWWPLKKIGFNNPLEVKLTPGYKKILDFWAGKGPKPLPAEAEAALMELAENVKLEKCIYHKDVIDAMFRQPHILESKPFKNYRIGAMGTIEATDYDLGRNGVAYSDRDVGDYHISSGGGWTSWNMGHTYRNDGVDIEPRLDKKGYFVNHIEPGEWLSYTFTLEKAGTYTLKLSTASNTDKPGLVTLSVGNYVHELSLPKTGGPQTWKAFGVDNVTLEKGTHTLKVIVVQGGFNFKSIDFVRK